MGRCDSRGQVFAAVIAFSPEQLRRQRLSTIGATEFFLGFFQPFINITSFDSRQVSSWIYILVFKAFFGEFFESFACVAFKV